MGLYQNPVFVVAVPLLRAWEVGILTFKYSLCGGAAFKQHHVKAARTFVELCVAVKLASVGHEHNIITVVVERGSGREVVEDGGVKGMRKIQYRFESGLTDEDKLSDLISPVFKILPSHILLTFSFPIYHLYYKL